MAFVIDSGPIEAEDFLRHVPRDKWRELMLARRRFLEVRLSHDCRCLVEFINDAKLMFKELGFASVEAMIRDGYGLEPAEVAVAVRWLELNPPSEPISLNAVRAITAQTIDALDRENQRPVGVHIKRDVDNNSGDVNVRPTGNSAAAAVRRLRKDRPDIHERVLAGELSAHAGMIEAGFRKKAVRKKPTALNQIIRLIPKLTAEELLELYGVLQGKCEQS